MNSGTRATLAALGPIVTLLFIGMSKERPLEASIQLLSLSFGVAGVVLAVGYVVRLRRGSGMRSVALTTGIGVALVVLAVCLLAVFNAQVRAWLPIMVVTGPAFTFPSIFGAALATCAGRSSDSPGTA